MKINKSNLEMKNVFLLLSASIIVLTSFTTSVKDGGQSICKLFIPSKVGTELTYKNFDEKEKLQSTDFLKILDVKNVDGGIEIAVHAWSKDKKDEIVFEKDLAYSCINGVFVFSMESMMDESMMEAYKDMEITLNQNNLQFPATLKVGETLPDGRMTMDIASNGMKIMTMSFDITDRKIVAEESVTTEAGTFTCFKMTSNLESKMAFMTINTSTIDWISYDIGTIRSEGYNKKGKLESVRELSAIN
jgi:hypothetical protein